MGHFRTVLFMLIVAPCALSDERGEPAAPGPKPVSLSVAISHLKKEATDSWRKRAPWPRREIDFAESRGWSVPETDVMRGLTRQLHPEPAIDAYVKWQLLSFVGDLPADDVEGLNRAMANTPRLLPQPVVREEWLAVSGPGSGSLTIARQTAYVQNFQPVVGTGAVGLQPIVGVVSSGTSIGVEGSTRSHITVIRQANDKLAAARREVDLANEMIVRYRDALIDRMPEAGGVRLAVEIKDLRDRAEAGEPTTEERIAAILSETERIDPDLPANTRQALAEWVTQTARVRTPRIESISLDEENRVVLHGRLIGLHEEDARLLISRLNGTASLSRPATPSVPATP